MKDNEVGFGKGRKPGICKQPGLKEESFGKLGQDGSPPAVHLWGLRSPRPNTCTQVGSAGQPLGLQQARALIIVPHPPPSERKREA